MKKLINIQNLAFPQLKPTFVAALIPTCVAINFAGFVIRQGLGVPLFLDSGGTQLATYIAGPVVGTVCGILQAVIRAITVNPLMLFAALPNVVTALLLGLACKKGLTRTWLGIVLTWVVITPFSCAASTLVFTYIYGGFSGTATDILKSVLIKSSGTIFSGAYIGDMLTNIADKAVLTAVVMAILRVLPKKYQRMTPFYQQEGKAQRRTTVSGS